MKKEELIKALKEERNDYHPQYNYDIRLGFEGAIEMVEELLDTAEPEKILIPQFVADWWERDADSVTMYGGESIDKKSKIHLISNFNERGLCDHLSKVEDWIDENESAFLDLVNGKDYEVEKEKLYVVELSNNNLMSCLAYDLVDKVFFISQTQEERLNKFKKRFTEQEIKDYDERFWPFAVEVEHDDDSVVKEEEKK